MAAGSFQQLTLGFVAHAGCSATDGCGLALLQTWQNGVPTVCSWEGDQTVARYCAAIPLPKQKFTHVHVNLVGPLSTSSRGHTHLLTIVDRTTWWPEVLHYAPSLLRYVWTPSWARGWHVMAFLSRWLHTGDPSSLAQHGGRCARHATPAINIQQRTTHYVTGWWSDSTGNTIVLKAKTDNNEETIFLTPESAFSNFEIKTLKHFCIIIFLCFSIKNNRRTNVI